MTDVGDAEQHEDDRNRGGLHDHLCFACGGCREVFAFAFEEASDGGDEELAAQHDQDHPRFDAADLQGFGAIEVVGEVWTSEEDEGAEHEDFVGEGIHHATELADDLPAASEWAVDCVGEGG